MPRVSHTESTAANIAARPGTQDGERPLVSVIVVNWNGLAYLPECLESLARQSYRRARDRRRGQRLHRRLRSSTCAAEHARSVRLVESPTNLGFAGGNNLGIRASKGAYVALLNNDAGRRSRAGSRRSWPRPRPTPRVGMCASQDLRLGPAGTSSTAPGSSSPATASAAAAGASRRIGRSSTREEDALLPSGCAALYRRAMLDEIGLFDEDFFAYCEDTDLGLRARLAGWRCRYVPGAVARHHYSARPATLALQGLPGRAQPDLGGRQVLSALGASPASLLYTLARYALQLYAAVSGRGAAARLAERQSPVALAGILLRAWWAALARLPEMLRRRRGIQSLRRISRGELGEAVARPPGRLERARIQGLMACLFCGSAALEPLYKGIRDHYGVDAETHRFLRCADCGSATLDPLPSPERLGHALLRATTRFKPESARSALPALPAGGRVAVLLRARLPAPARHHQALDGARPAGSSSRSAAAADSSSGICAGPATPSRASKPPRSMSPTRASASG